MLANVILFERIILVLPDCSDKVISQAHVYVCPGYIYTHIW